MLEKLTRADWRLLLACAAIAAVSLFVGVRYYFLAFPEASIEFRVTRESSVPVAESFLRSLHLDSKPYRHAAIFAFDDEQKTFLGRELGVAESNRLLETTVRLWRWRHRWFRPLQKEELSVELTTKGEVVGFEHQLAEEAPGSNLATENARQLAEAFLAGTMHRPLASLAFLETSSQTRPHRTDHSFTWKVIGSEVKGADYRVAVDIAGGAVSGYREWLKVPDTWVRGYEKLRSKNETANLVDNLFLLLTVLAMLGFLATRVRRGDVRWRAAAVLGGVTFLLLTVSQLNSLPSELYDYDTTASFAGYLISKVLLGVAGGLAVGVLILLLAAAAEPIYRERFPARLSVTSLLRLRAWRTRETFVAVLAGLTLTCFFFAYENVFYLIAHRLGAWSPREVAYSDLLSTAFPWVYVLFFGFLPAISEELISRVFSVPFFERLFRSTAFAIVVAAFIWSFGHAGYPNQPWWIRGLEVGLAGIVFGLAFLRFGIVSVLVCHFSVDALYTAFVLIRSPNVYYVVSGSLSAAIFLLLFIAAAVAYRVRGGFLPPEVTNAVEGVAAPPEPRVEPVSAEPAAVGYQPLTGARIAWGLLLAAGLAALAFAPVRRLGDWVALRSTRDSARDSATAFLRDAGFDVSPYRRIVRMQDRTDATAAAYLLETGGAPAVERVYGTLAPTPLWRVRFFVPGQKEEHWVSVDANSGKAVGFRRTLLDDAPGARLPKEQALALVRAFLLARGVDLAHAELKEQTQKDEKARRDHTLTWELAVPGAGEAKVRHEVVVQGDKVGSWTREVKIPEAWRRAREKETALTVIVRWLKLPLLGVFAALGILLLVAKIRSGEFPWKAAALFGAIAAVAVLVRLLLSLDTLWTQYDTAIPAGTFAIVIGVSLAVGALGSAVAAATVAGLAAAIYPEALSMWRAPARRVFARDALVAGFVTLGIALGLSPLRDLFAALVPSGRLFDGVSWPNGVEASVPWLATAARAISTTLFVAALAAIAAAVAGRHFRTLGRRALLALLVALSFLPPLARTPAEYAAGLLALAVLVAGVLVLAIFFLRHNPLAWVTAAWLGLGGAGAIRLLAEPGGHYRFDGAVALALVLLPVAWLALAARPGSAVTRAAAPPATQS